MKGLKVLRRRRQKEGEEARGWRSETRVEISGASIRGENLERSTLLESGRCIVRKDRDGYYDRSDN